MVYRTKIALTDRLEKEERCMTYVKLQDGRLIYAPKKIKNGDTITYNPTGEMLLSLGYKPLTIMPMPEVEYGYHLEPIYSETDTEVIEDWEVVEDPPVEPDAEEILSILTGGAE